MSDIKLTYHGRVDGGKLILPGHKIRLEAKVFDGKEIELTIRKKRKRRSDPQNRYYFGVVVEMVRIGLKDMTGEIFNSDEAHDFLKMRFLKRPLADTNGEQIGEKVLSTTKLDTIEFSEYIEQCCAFAAEYLGISIPPPE